MSNERWKISYRRPTQNRNRTRTRGKGRRRLIKTIIIFLPHQQTRQHSVITCSCFKLFTLCAPHKMASLRNRKDHRKLRQHVLPCPRAYSTPGPKYKVNPIQYLPLNHHASKATSSTKSVAPTNVTRPKASKLKGRIL